jgi:cytidylate kinase
LLDRQRAFRRRALSPTGGTWGPWFPRRGAKVFLTASPEERAARRYKQLIDKGMRATMAALLEDIRTRDKRDSERAVAPLKMCADAILLDTTRMSVSEAVAQVLAQYKSASTAP